MGEANGRGLAGGVTGLVRRANRRAGRWLRARARSGAGHIVQALTDLGESWWRCFYKGTPSEQAWAVILPILAMAWMLDAASALVAGWTGGLR